MIDPDEAVEEYENALRDVRWRALDLTFHCAIGAIWVVVALAGVWAWAWWFVGAWAVTAIGIYFVHLHPARRRRREASWQLDEALGDQGQKKHTKVGASSP